MRDILIFPIFLLLLKFSPPRDFFQFSVGYIDTLRPIRVFFLEKNDSGCVLNVM